MENCIFCKISNKDLGSKSEKKLQKKVEHMRLLSVKNNINTIYNEQITHNV